MSGSAKHPLAPARKDYYRGEWQRVEERFAHAPAEAARAAESLLRELTREVGAGPVTRTLLRKQQTRPVNRAIGYGGDAEMGAALADAALGIFRFIRSARAASRQPGTDSAHFAPEELSGRMQLYRSVFLELLGPAPDLPLDTNLDTSAPEDASYEPRFGRRMPGTPGSLGGGGTFVKLQILQLVLSLALGLLILLAIMWIFSR